MTNKRQYSQKLYHTCLDFFLDENQDYMTRDYQSRYYDMIIAVYDVYGTLNERSAKEYRDAEYKADQILNSPVMKVMRDE